MFDHHHPATQISFLPAALPSPCLEYLTIPVLPYLACHTYPSLPGISHPASCCWGPSPCWSQCLSPLPRQPPSTWSPAVWSWGGTAPRESLSPLGTHERQIWCCLLPLVCCLWFILAPVLLIPITPISSSISLWFISASISLHYLSLLFAYVFLTGLSFILLS